MGGRRLGSPTVTDLPVWDGGGRGDFVKVIPVLIWPFGLHVAG